MVDGVGFALVGSGTVVRLEYVACSFLYLDLGLSTYHFNIVCVSPKKNPILIPQKYPYLLAHRILIFISNR